MGITKVSTPSALDALLCGAAASRMRSAASRSCGLQAGRSGLRQALEIQHPTDQERILLHPAVATTPESSQAMPILAFPEQLFDELATPLRELIAGAAHAHPDPRMGGGAPARLHRDVRLDLAREHRG